MKNLKNDFRKSICIFSFFIFFSLAILFFVAWIKSFSFAFIKDFKNSQNINFSNIFYNLFYTFSEALLSTLISLIIGIPASYFISKKKFIFKNFLISFSAIPLCIPAIIVALGYISTFGISGLVNDFLKSVFYLEESPLKFLYSFWGIIICQGFYNFPLIMITTSNTWRNLSSDEEDIAKILGASNFKIFRKITFHKLQGAIFSASIPVFLFCYFSFMIVQLFGSMDGTTLEVSIYHAARSSMNFEKAGILSLIETFFALAILFLYSISEKKSNLQKGTLPKKNNDISKLSLKDLPLFIPFIILVFIFFILPIFCIIIKSFETSKGISNGLTFVTWKKFFLHKDLLKSILNTLKSASVTAILSVLSGTTLAIINYSISKKSKNNIIASIVSTLPILPMAVSSVVLSIGISFLFKRPSLIHLCFTQAALFWPFSYKIILSSLKKIPDSVIDSALILSNQKSDLIFDIYIPYVKNAIFSSLGLSFAMSAGDATIPLVLGMQNFSTLSLFTFRLAGSYRLNEACCSGILLGSICMVAFFTTQFSKTKNILISKEQ